jgi:broad specificity phosphatase PhoE
MSYYGGVVDALRVFVVRHGGTRWTRERRFAGSQDVPLDDAGRARAEALARLLSPHPIAAVYTSPLQRARATAALIAAPHGQDVRIEAAFVDMGFGAWEGLTADEVATRFPEAWTTWREAPAMLTAHGGERVEQAAGRVVGAIGRLQHAHPGETVVVVSHAIAVRVIVLAALGLGSDRLWSVDASPAGLTELEYSRDWVTVHRMNTLAHLTAVVALADDAGRPGVPGAPDAVAAVLDPEPAP